MGRLVAAWTKATCDGLELSVAINHEAPTLCSQVPMFEATLAIHSQRKTRFESGRQGEGGRAGVVVVADSGESRVVGAVAISASSVSLHSGGVPMSLEERVGHLRGQLDLESGTSDSWREVRSHRVPSRMLPAP